MGRGGWRAYRRVTIEHTCNSSTFQPNLHGGRAKGAVVWYKPIPFVTFALLIGRTEWLQRLTAEEEEERKLHSTPPKWGILFSFGCVHPSGLTTAIQVQLY